MRQRWPRLHHQAFHHEGEIGSVEVFSSGGTTRLTSLEVHELKSAWK